MLVRPYVWIRILNLCPSVCLNPNSQSMSVRPYVWNRILKPCLSVGVSESEFSNHVCPSVCLIPKQMSYHVCQFRVCDIDAQFIKKVTLAEPFKPINKLL